MQRVRELRHAYAIKRAFARNALRFQDFRDGQWIDIAIYRSRFADGTGNSFLQTSSSRIQPARQNPSLCRANSKLEKIAPHVQVHFISSQHVGAQKLAVKNPALHA